MNLLLFLLLRETRERERDLEKTNEENGRSAIFLIYLPSSFDTDRPRSDLRRTLSIRKVSKL
jgi:hypothetical protein